MENTTPYYDDADGPFVTPCSRYSDNNVGAKLSILYYFMFLISLFGNGLVLIIIYRFERLTTVTNILLLNLVFSSIIFMSSLPFLAVQNQLSEWIFGKVMCRIVGSSYYLGLYSSVLFLTILTIDRHIAVVYSLDASRLRGRRYAMISCAVVWIISSLACICPMITHILYKYNTQGVILCGDYPGTLDYIDHSRLKVSHFYMQLFLFLIIPLVVIIYCYIRIAITVLMSRIATKFKTVRLIFIIVVWFFVSWTPFNIVTLLKQEDNCLASQRRGYALHITRNITYIYFCFSPIFYTFVGRKFQNHFRLMLVKRFPVLKRYISVTPNSNTSMSTKCSPSD
ncbi:chemokine (C-C motif) receptor 12a [Cynoglossus semilaevis]|uniref:C-C chemokine receptor type 3-like n=1 Tax=Cynoglossus semilaevis TaxID=244447 RepID=A0A3P8VDA6_CYNSE|nr:C-C chemokine receptor type 3-like [Cynoglossus semilaevis]